MKIIINIINFLKKVSRWYQEPIPGHRIFRADPLTIAAILTFIAGLTSIVQYGESALQLDNSKAAGTEWRNASTELKEEIETAYNNNQITGYDREVALQRLEEMTPIFSDIAFAIEKEGREDFENTAYQGLFDSAVTLLTMGLNGVTGNLVGAAGLGDLYTAYSLGNYVDTLGQTPLTEEQQALINVGNFFVLNTQTSLSDEQAQIYQQLMEVWGMDADSLFIARMRTKINVLRGAYIGLLEKNPCDKEKILADFRAELIGQGWGAGTGVYGEGEKFPSHAAFIDWLIAEATAIDVDITCEDSKEETGDEPPSTEEGEDTLANCNATQLVEITNGNMFEGENNIGTPYCEYSLNIKNTSEDEAIWVVYLLHQKDGYQNTESSEWFALGWLGYFEPGYSFEWTGDVWKNYLVDKDFSGPNINIMEKVAAYHDTEACRLLQGDETFYEDVAVPVQSLCPYE